MFYLESAEIGSALSTDTPNDVRSRLASVARERREL